VFLDRDSAKGGGLLASHRAVTGNAAKTAREQLRLIPIFEELRGRG
jgi:hypothetical protein